MTYKCCMYVNVFIYKTLLYIFLIILLYFNLGNVIRREGSLFIFTTEWTNWPERTVQFHTVLLYSFIYGGPCHHCSFKECSGDQQTACSLIYGKNNSAFVLFPHSHCKLKFWLGISSPKPHSAPLCHIMNAWLFIATLTSVNTVCEHL